MRILKKVLAYTLLIILIAGSSFLLWVSQRYTVPIIMYHHVANVEKRRSDTVSPQNFERHMQFLADHQYEVISFSKLIEGMKKGKQFSRKTIVLTFDDGYRNNYENAFPILKKYGFPAIIFMVSDWMGAEGFLTLDQLKEMQTQGIEIGAHSKTHAYLPDLSYDEQKLQIGGSKKDLEKKLKESVFYFAYPVGGFNNQIIGLVKEAGFEAACTTNRGFVRENKDIFELKRVRVSDRDNSDFLLLFKFSGYYNALREGKKPDSRGY